MTKGRKYQANYSPRERKGQLFPALTSFESHSEPMAVVIVGSKEAPPDTAFLRNNHLGQPKVKV